MLNCLLSLERLTDISLTQNQNLNCALVGTNISIWNEIRQLKRLTDKNRRSTVIRRPRKPVTSGLITDSAELGTPI